MKRICVMGSINVDVVFGVRSIVRPGETISSTSVRRFLGGKGQNQATALRKAYPDVLMCGNIGAQDAWIVREMESRGLDTSLVLTVGGDTGGAFIQVEESGQNCIVLAPGANHSFTEARIDSAFAALRAGDLVVLQNETNLLGYMIGRARELGLEVAFNPSPFVPSLRDLPLEKLDYLILNEVEGEGLCGSADPGIMLERLGTMLPATVIVLTLGAEGAACREGGRMHRVAGMRVEAVDTTAAGDTFMGFFLAGVAGGLGIPEAIRRANVAAAISVTRPGAASSIPSAEEVEMMAGHGGAHGE